MPGLARAGLRGEVRLPLGEPVAVLGDPAGQVRGVAVAHRAAQHRKGEPVDLEEDDPRRRPSCAIAPWRRATRRITRSEYSSSSFVPAIDLEDDRRGGHHERREQRVPERVDADGVGEGVGGELQRDRVDEQHRQEADREHPGQPQRRDHRRQDRVDHAIPAATRKAAPGSSSATRQQPGRDPDRRGRDEPRDQQAQRPEPGVIGSQRGVSPYSFGLAAAVIARSTGVAEDLRHPVHRTMLARRRDRIKVGPASASTCALHLLTSGLVEPRATPYRGESSYREVRAASRSRQPCCCSWASQRHLWHRRAGRRQHLQGRHQVRTRRPQHSGLGTDVLGVSSSGRGSRSCPATRWTHFRIVAGSLGAIGALLSIGDGYPWWSLAVFALCVYIVHGIMVYGEDEDRSRARACA